MSHTANANITEPPAAPVEPTAEDMRSARDYLKVMPGRRDQAEWVASYLGSIITDLAKYGFVADSRIRRGVALHRVWGEGA